MPPLARLGPFRRICVCVVARVGEFQSALNKPIHFTYTAHTSTLLGATLPIWLKYCLTRFRLESSKSLCLCKTMMAMENICSP